MTKAIYKYQITDTPLQVKSTITMPSGAKMLHAGTDPAGNVCVWAEIDDQFDDREYHFQTVWTGFEPPDKQLAYLGMCTVQNEIVVHIYWVVN